MMAAGSASHPRVWLEVNLTTLGANYRRIAEAVAPAGVIAVLKSNAYGLGVQPVAAALAQAGAAGFGVAEPQEAHALAALHLPVQILGAVLPEEIPNAVAEGVILPATDLATARLIRDEAQRQGRPATVHLKIDSGMGRLGILLEDAPRVVREIVGLPGLRCDGIYSHFPLAYHGGGECTERQIEGFIRLLADLSADGIRFRMCHIANSDAINNFPRTVRPPFTHVRTGINLHGSFDTEGRRVLKLESVLTLKTRLVARRLLPQGHTIGYGCTYRLPRPTLVGTISAGYADGLPLALSNRGYVQIRGRLCPVLGRISMDYTTVSLDQAPEAEVGDDVICLGGRGSQAISVEEWAQLKGTHPYDIICSFGNRVERRYVT